MKAYQIIKYKQPAEFRNIKIPTLKADEILIDIKASGLNPVDYKIQAGKLRLLMKYNLPLTMGNELAGVVAKVGAEVHNFKPGDRVFARPSHEYTGTLTEQIALPADQVALLPANIDLSAASGVPLTGLTSYQALMELGHLKPGQKVFIQAGAGGIGTMAIQIAKALGAYVTTTASAKNTELVKSLGADHVINYRETYFADVLTDYDIVFDTLGGKYLEDSFKILKPHGELITINGLPDYQFGREHGFSLAKSLLFKLASRKLTRLATKYQVNYHFLLMHASGEQLAILSEMMQKQQLKPIVDKIYQFEAVPAAYQYLKAGHARGKVIVEL